MRTRTLWCSVALGGWMIGAANVAGATDHGFYADVDAGAASYSRDVQVKLFGTTPFDGPTYKAKNSRVTDFAWSFAAGYRFNQYVAAELGFSDLGQAQADLVNTDDAKAPPGHAKYSYRGKSLALLAHLPMGNWDPYLKLGAIHAIYDEKLSVPNSGSEWQRGAHSEQTQWLVGIGARYAFSERWAMSFAVDGYLRRVAPETPNVFSPRVGFAYRF